jgi:hypothetical protein
VKTVDMAKANKNNNTNSYLTNYRQKSPKINQPVARRAAEIWGSWLTQRAVESLEIEFLEKIKLN